MSQINCSTAIQQAIGSFFLRCGQIVDGIVLNNTIPEDELTARTQILEVFILRVNAKVRQAFLDLAADSPTKCKKSCSCVAAADAIANIAIGFINFAYQATLALGNPTLPSTDPFQTLQQVLDLIFQDFNESITLILKLSAHTEEEDSDRKHRKKHDKHDKHDKHSH